MLSNRDPASRQDDEPSVGDDPDLTDRGLSFGDLRASELHQVTVGRGRDPRPSQRLRLEVGDSLGGGNREGYLFPGIEHGNPNGDRIHGTVSVRVDRKRSTDWSNNKVEARTRRRPSPSRTAIAISSPP